MKTPGSFFKTFAHPKPERFFVLAATILSVFYLVITPPFQSPDELHHFYRIYQVSEGQFAPVKLNGRAGGEIPECFNGLYLRFKHIASPEWKIKWRDLFHTFSIPYSEQGKKFQDFPDTAFYTPVSYLPQSLLFFILKHLPLSMGAIYYILRVFSLFLWIACMWYCVKKIPVARWLLTALLLLPMQIYVSCSLSGDLMNNCLCFLTIALGLDKLYVKPSFTKHDVLLFSCLGVLLIFTKLFYAALLLILFLIPSEKFGDRKKKTVMLCLILLPVFVTAFLRSSFIDTHYMTFDSYDPAFRKEANLQPGADYKAQKEFLTEHPGNIPSILFRSVEEHASSYLGSYVADFGRYMGIQIPSWLYLLTFLLLIPISVFDKNDIRLRLTHRLFFLALAFALFFTLILSLYLQWTPLKADAIIGFQGRYLFPVFPLFFLAFSGLFFSKIKSRKILIVFLALLHTCSISVLANSFYVPQGYRKLEFLVKEETTDTNFLLTDHEKIKLELRAATRDESVRRSGRSSIRIPPWADTTCHFVFDNFRTADQIQIRAYVKGRGTQLCLTGRSATCSHFYFFYGEPSYTDKDGWSALDLVMHSPQDCPHTKIHFYIRNLSDSVAYVDELDFRLWKQ